MDLAQIETFDCIVREGNFSRAAWKLDLTQPTISARVQSLEEEMGVSLFLRSGRTLVLTDAGERFLPYARHLLATWREGVDITRQVASGKRGRISIGVIESLAGGFLAEAMADFQQTIGGAEFYVRSGHSEDVAEMLRNRTVQLGLMLEPHRWREVKPLLWFTEPVVLAVGVNNSLANEQAITLSDLIHTEQQVWVVPWNFSRLPEKIAQLAGATASIPINMAHSLLRRGYGAAFLSREQIADDLQRGVVVEVDVSDLPAMHRHFALVRLDGDEPLPPLTTRFVRTLQQQAGTLFDEED